jgi:hypothetical protein
MVRDANQFIMLKMVFVLVWTTSKANNLSCQSLFQVHFVSSSMSSCSVPQSRFISIIICGTTKKVAMEQHP